MQLSAQDESDRLVIFGYGSLIWKPNFTYQKRVVGFIKGYHRRFYQGNTTHRGTREQPGRVATLIAADKPDARVWGCVYEIVGQKPVQEALEHLNEREVVNGGYEFVQTDFYPIRADSAALDKMRAWVCVHMSASQSIDSKTQNNLCSSIEVNLYLGDAPLDVQASQIASACGTCGFNSEYLFRIAAFMRTEVPPAQSRTDDPYLFRLERLVRLQIARARHAAASEELREDCLMRNPYSSATLWATVASLFDKDKYADNLATMIPNKTSS